MEKPTVTGVSLPADRQLTRLFARLDEMIRRRELDEERHERRSKETRDKLGELQRRITTTGDQIRSCSDASDKVPTALKNFVSDYAKEIRSAYLVQYGKQKEEYLELKSYGRKGIDDIQEKIRQAKDQHRVVTQTMLLFDEYMRAWSRFCEQHPRLSRIFLESGLFDLAKFEVDVIPDKSIDPEFGFRTKTKYVLNMANRAARVRIVVPEYASVMQRLVCRISKLLKRYPEAQIAELGNLARRLHDALWNAAYFLTSDELESCGKYDRDNYYSGIRQLHVRLAEEIVQRGAACESMQKAHDSAMKDLAFFDQSCSPENVVRAECDFSDSERTAIAERVFARHPGCPAEFIKNAAGFPDPYLNKNADAKFAELVRRECERYAGQVGRKLDEYSKTHSAEKSALNGLTEEMKKLDADRQAREAKQETDLRNWQAELDTLRRADPVTVPLWTRDEPTREEARTLCGAIRSAAARRVTMPALPVDYDYVATMDDGLKTVPRPVLLPWQNPDGEGCNFVIDYHGAYAPKAFHTLHHLLMSMLLAFPAKKLRFSFVDLNMTNAVSPFTINLDGRLYHNQPVVREQELRKLLEELQDRMVSVSMQCGNLLEYNLANGTILFPYEVVVLLDYPKNLSPQTLNQLKSLATNGYKGGIFFVVLRETDDADSDGRGFANQPDIVTPENFRQVTLLQEDGAPEGYPYRFLPVFENETLRKACFDYVNEEARKEEKARTLVQPLERLLGEPMEDAAAGFRVDVGESNGRPAPFRLDEINHIHSFVLGQSGSGKSVFLHDVIGNAILRYSPESLQLYLLDFKLGGVEFNRYKDVKHVKALLVDNSDPQITLEILRDLHETMRRRGEQLRSAGASTLREYNEIRPEGKLPRIVVVADECHELFRDRVDKTQAEVNAIVARIAKEGRSQGVHLLFATQTLANANISPEILNNITDHYLLKCAQTDAEKLVRDSSKQTSSLTTGWILYRHSEEQNLFQAYYADKERLQRIIGETMERTGSSAAGNRFFFSGRQSFPLDGSVCSALESRIRRNPVGLMGRSIDVRLEPVGLSLKPALSENVLLFGINTEEQTTRTSLNLLVTLMASCRRMNRPVRFYVMNCLNAAESVSEELLGRLESFGCTVVENAAMGRLLGALGDEVRSRTAQQSVVLLLGQERFREVRLEQPLPETGSATAEPAPASGGFLGDLGAFGRDRVQKRTYKSELRYLLENGSEQGVHFLLQVDKPGNLLFENVLSQQAVFSMFKHIVMLRSAPDAALKLRLSDDLRLESLSDDPQRLRAYYYNDEEGSYTLFTPYVNPAPERLTELLK